MSTLNALTSGGGITLSGDTSGNVQIQSAGANSAVFNSFGIGLGNTAPTSGLGITFPATQSSSTNANTLDDYEEGTWTPSVLFNNAVSSGQTGTFAGFYTKVGNQVFATGLINLTNKGSGSGYTSIGGLPFTSNSNSNYRALMQIFWSGTATAYVYMLALLGNSGTSAELLAATAATTDMGNNPQESAINNTTAFRFSITYQVS
jgi:hypothetical protein